jgi:hypothetical protein
MGAVEPRHHSGSRYRPGSGNRDSRCARGREFAEGEVSVISPALQIVSRRSPVELAEAEQAKSMREAYILVHCLSNSPWMSAEGLEVSIRVQAYLCKRYTEITCKGWPRQ